MIKNKTNLGSSRWKNNNKGKEFSLAFTVHSPHSHSSKIFTRLPPQKVDSHTVTAYKNTTKHTVVQSGSCGPGKVFPLTLSENWQAGPDNKQLSPEHEDGRKKKKKNRRLRKQIWVMSSKLNGKPCVRKTGESIHIYCCQDFNINIIESTSDVSLSTNWLTKRSTNCQLYLMKMKMQQKG